MNTQIYEEACTWLVELRTGDAGATTRRRFESWLGKSPERVQAYLELIPLWENAHRLDADRKLDIEALIVAARAESNVIALQSAATAAVPERSLRRRGPLYGLAAAACIMTVAAGVAVWPGLYRHPIYTTQLGEQRTIRLEDSSTVELNARSRIRVRYSERERAIDLLAGQALFRVAKSTSRPFIVSSGEARVRAIGTQFDVNQKKSGTVVTVLEGRVALSSAPSLSGGGAGVGTSFTVLFAGEQATLTAAAVAHPKRANVVAATAWTQDRLVFESAPLAEVAEEFNRYNSQRLVVAGEALRDFHISGTFATSDPATLPRFLTFLREQPGIRLLESDDRVVVTRK